MDQVLVSTSLIQFVQWTFEDVDGSNRYYMYTYIYIHTNRHRSMIYRRRISLTKCSDMDRWQLDMSKGDKPILWMLVRVEEDTGFIIKV